MCVMVDSVWGGDSDFASNLSQESHTSAFRTTPNDSLSVPNLTCQVSRTLKPLMPQLVSGVLLYQAFSPYLTTLRQWGGMCGGWTLSAARKEWDTSGPGAERQAETQENLRKQRDADDEKRLCNTLQDAIDKFQASKLFPRDFPITSHQD